MEETKINVRDLIGKRCLMKQHSSGTNNWYNDKGITEYKILEVSPSGLWVKLINMNGNKFWELLSGIQLIEILQDLTSTRSNADAVKE